MVKEVRIKLDEQLFERLKAIARRELRSTNKQAIAFIVDGLKTDETIQTDQEAASDRPPTGAD